MLGQGRDSHDCKAVHDRESVEFSTCSECFLSAVMQGYCQFCGHVDKGSDVKHDGGGCFVNCDLRQHDTQPFAHPSTQQSAGFESEILNVHPSEQGTVAQEAQRCVASESIEAYPKATVAVMFNLAEKAIHQRFDPHEVTKTKRWALVCMAISRFGNPHSVPGVRDLVPKDSPRGDRALMAHGAPCEMGGEAWSSLKKGGHEVQDGFLESSNLGLQGDHRQESEASGIIHDGEARERECLAACSFARDRGPEDRLGTSTGPSERSTGDVAELIVPEKVCRDLSHGWDPKNNIWSTSWSSLVHHGRPLLMEVACYEDSVLSCEVERRYGSGSTMRLSVWNGGDLTTPEGVQLIKKKLRQHRPVHLWLSCDCAPYCPLQRINQRSEAQIARLREKQAYARKQYQGAIEVGIEAHRLKIEVHWELSERCEAWKLEEIQSFVQQLGLEKVTTNGCAVGLRTRDGSKSLCKAWTIATRNSSLLQRLHLPCQRNHPKGRCEGGQTLHTARYTQVFAKKVVDCLSSNETWSKVVQDVVSPSLEENFAAADDISPEEVQFEPGEEQEIERKIQHIHRSTGHGSMTSLIRALERRGVADKVLHVAKNWQCQVCAQKKLRDPRRFSTLETQAAKWEVMEIDGATWLNPISKTKVHFVVMVDAGNRFTVSRVLHEHPTKTATFDDMKRCMEESWFPMFGRPKAVRADPAGAWNSEKAGSYMAEHDMVFDVVPGEAHWQISTVEQTIKTIKGVLSQLAEDFPSYEARELMAQTVWAVNQRSLYKGFSPLQHMLGKAPDESGRMFENPTIRPVHPELLRDGGFAEDEKLRVAAEKAFLEEQAKRKLERAERMGHRKFTVYMPGDLVHYWRNQLPHSEKGAFQSGRFLGPARVLATETRKEDGEWRPGSVIWIYSGTRLLKAAPEQLRHASQYEMMLEEMKGPCEIPWTISHLAEDATKRFYTDISTVIPNDEQWEESSRVPPGEPGREVLEPRKRVHGKGPGDLGVRQRHPKVLKEEPLRGEKREGEEKSASSSSGSKKLKSEAEMQAFYAKDEHRRVWEVELPMPESRRGLQKFLQNPAAYMACQLKRRQVEVREKTLSQEEVMQFSKAKGTKVKNFIASSCFEKAQGDIPPESEIIGMRWLLTWKFDPKYEGGKKAKARAIVLGYQDPSYSQRKTSSPTPSKAGRQLFLQFCAWRRFQIAKGDVSGAFLQGDDLEETLWCRPVPEICEAMGIDPDTPMVLRKAAYGLVQAPLHWYESICKSLKTLGYTRLITEPCCWVYLDEPGKVRSIIHGHVDDFMFGGSPEDPVHQRLMKELQALYK